MAPCIYLAFFDNLKFRISTMYLERSLNNLALFHFQRDKFSWQVVALLTLVGGSYLIQHCRAKHLALDRE